MMKTWSKLLMPMIILHFGTEPPRLTMSKDRFNFRQLPRDSRFSIVGKGIKLQKVFHQIMITFMVFNMKHMILFMMLDQGWLIMDDQLVIYNQMMSLVQWVWLI